MKCDLCPALLQQLPCQRKTDTGTDSALDRREGLERPIQNLALNSWRAQSNCNLNTVLFRRSMFFDGDSEASAPRKYLDGVGKEGGEDLRKLVPVDRNAAVILVAAIHRYSAGKQLPLVNGKRFRQNLV